MAGPAAGFVVTAAADIVLATRLARHGQRQPDEPGRPAQRHTDGDVAAIAAVIAWSCGVVAAVIGLAALITWQGEQHGASWSGAAWLALVFLAAAVAASAGPARSAGLESLARPAAFASGALAGIGLATIVSPALSTGWGLACAGVSGFCLSAAALLLEPRSDGQPTARQRDFAAGSAALVAVAGAVAAPAAVAGLFPARPVLPAWSGSGSAGTGRAIWPDLPAAITVLALCALACLCAQSGRTGLAARFRPFFGAIGLAAAAIAAGSLPAAVHLTGWGRLIVLTAATVTMLAAAAVLRERTLANVAAGCGCALALTAAAWSLAGRGTTLAELAALAVAFGLAAARTRHAAAAVVSTSGALAAATGLAWAAPMAAGWPAERAALPGLGVAVLAVAAATALRRTRPMHAIVLDLGACAVALLAAVVATGRQDIFAVVAVASALIASAAAWLRTGPQRSVAAATAACAALAAILAQGGPLGRALLIPAQILAHPWRQPGPAATPHPAGLPLAVVVLAVCLAALAAAAGAWRGSRRVSMDIVAVALPLVAAPAGLASLEGPGSATSLSWADCSR